MLNKSVSIENNFTKGLLTEATGLNFPENACVETYDCIFDRTGEVYRRPGIELEDPLISHQVDDISDSAITEFIWRTVALTGETVFLAVQIGSIISFWQIDELGNAAPNIKDFTIDLNDYKTPGSPAVEDINVSFAAGNGQLYVAHPSCNPIISEYKPDTDTLVSSAIILKIRDLTGLPNYKKGTTEFLDNDHRPTDAEFGFNAIYNLLNRGWGEPRTVTWNRKFWGFTTPLAAWRHAAIEFVPNAFALFAAGLVNLAAISDLKAGRTDWPSNADQIELMKQPIYPAVDDTGNVVTPVPPAEAFSILGIDESQPGNTPAPRGKFIFDAFHIHRAGIVNDYNGHPVMLNSGELAAIITDTAPSPEYTLGRPSQICFFAGRVWYAGTDNNYAHINIDTPKYNTRIYFSQIVEGNQHYDKCYQNNDPSASEAPSNDLLPSDGGVVVIPEVNKVIKLLPMGSSLLVFCTNGVWRISGSNEGGGFTAIDYTVTKMSDFGAISALNFVVVDGAPMWWNSEGIYTIASTGQSAQVAVPQVTSVTDLTIRDFFEDIPIICRRYAKGIFNKSEKVVQWIYRSTTPTTVQERYRYDRVLNVDTRTGAFYPWTISDSCLYVTGITVIEDFGSSRAEEVVTDAGVDVTDGGDDVTDTVSVVSDLATRTKFIVFNECNDTGHTATDAALTYDRNFYGTVGVGDIGFTTINSPAHNAVIKGEDGKYYLSVSGEDGPSATNLSLIQYNSDGTANQVLYPLTSFTLDINNALGSSFATFPLTYKVFPLPYTQYFYVMSGQQTGGLDGAVVAGLYKINSSGQFEFQNAARRWNGTFWDAFFFGQLGIASALSVDYETSAADPADRPLLISVATAVDGFHMARLPSMNTFIATSGAVGTASTDLWTGYVDAYPGASTGGNIFILPGATTARLYRYVDYTTAQAHQTPGGFQSAAILALAPSHPNGFMMSSPIDSVNWTIADSQFKDINGNALVPFADLWLDRDGTDPGTSDRSKNDWRTPTHQYDPNTNTHYLMWNRVYRPTTANQSSLGTYRTVMLQTWNPNTEIATEIANTISGNPFDTLNDLNSGTQFGSYPDQSMAFMDTGTNDIFVFSFYTSIINPGRNWALAKFGEFTPGTAATSSTGLSFAEFTNEDYIDWAEVTAGDDYTSYFVTGYKVRGEALRKFQSNYLQIYANNENFSSFDVNSRWDYAISGNSGRWSSTQRVTMDNDLFSVRTKRLKMRGHGKALQFKVSSVTGEPFNLIGWSIYETTNATI